MTRRYSFHHLDDGSWGVKESADLGQAGHQAGQTVEVTKRDGGIQQVTLGSLVTTWNGARAAVYTKAASAHQARPSRGATWADRAEGRFDAETEYDDMAAAEYDDMAAAVYQAQGTPRGRLGLIEREAEMLERASNIGFVPESTWDAMRAKLDAARAEVAAEESAS